MLLTFELCFLPFLIVISRFYKFIFPRIRLIEKCILKPQQHIKRLHLSYFVTK